MKVLIAGMHYTPNQFTRGAHNLGLQWVHFKGKQPREHLPKDCNAAIIARCQISHGDFYRVKEEYLAMKKPIFVAVQSFSEIAEPMQEWLKKVGHLNELGVVQKSSFAPPEKKPTAMSLAFQQAQRPEPKELPAKPKVEATPPPTPKEEPVQQHVSRNDYEQIRGVVNKMIQEEYAKGTPWAEITDKLNQHNLPTAHGKQWTTTNVSQYANSHNLVERNRVPFGGHTGATNRPEPSSPAPTPAPVRSAPAKKKKSDGEFTEQELEEIMTSNLHTSLKLRIIKILVKSED